MKQADKVVEVDGDLARILSQSRFAEDFTFEPPGQEHCGGEVKVSMTEKNYSVFSGVCLIHSWICFSFSILVLCYPKWLR